MMSKMTQSILGCALRERRAPTVTRPRNQMPTTDQGSYHMKDRQYRPLRDGRGGALVAAQVQLHELLLAEVEQLQRDLVVHDLLVR